MQSPIDPTSCKVLVPLKGNRAGRAADTVVGAIPVVEFGGATGASRSVERTRIGLVTLNTRAAKPPEMLKPAPAGKRFSDAPVGLSGVKGGGACRRGDGEHERAVVAAGAWTRPPEPGNHNRRRCRVRQSERLIVATKRLIPVERRSLGVSGADSKVRAV
jgi:hypothetical protein